MSENIGMRLYGLYRILKVATVFMMIPALYGCTKEVFIDFPEHEKRITINSFFKSEERISAEISHSTSFDDYSSNNILLSTIEIYENNELVESAISSDSIFTSNVIARENHVYKLVVSAPDYPPVVAIDTVPGKVNISNVSFVGPVTYGESGYERFPLIITFSDETSEENYYELKQSIRFPDPKTPGNFINRIGSIVFTDILFNGESYNFESYYKYPSISIENFELEIRLNSISRSYYEYKVQLAKYLNDQDVDIVLGPPEPFIPYSNVNGGYGIFAAYSSDERTYYIQRK